MVKRDGAQVSLWQRTTFGYNVANTPDKQHVYDVIIVGGGITGLATALRLQEEGKQCLVIEAWTLGFGTTGGTTAHLNTLLDTPYTTIIKNFGTDAAKQVAQAAQMGVDLVRSNVARYQIDCGLQDADALLYAQNEREAKDLLDIYKASSEVGIDVNFVDTLPISAQATEIMVARGQAKFHPLQYIFGLAAAFEKAGGHIMQNTRMESMEEGDIITVYSSSGTLRGKNLVYATHIPCGINVIHLRCIPYRSYAMAVKISQHYPAELVYDMQDPYHYIRTQDIDGEPHLIVGGEDHKTAHEPNTMKCFRSLENFVHHHFEVTDIVSRWSSQYFESVDGLPYIGHYPGHRDNVFAATGYGGNGMTHSHIAAQLLTDTILERESPLQPLFSPARIKPLAGLKAFVEHNADVVKQFIGKWFAVEELEVLSALAPGEGKVVKHRGETLALNKDTDGKLHAVSPACTHMKCSVAWNQMEQSWECPCHGARYNPDGQVITGPASIHLESVELRTLASKNVEQVKP